MPSAKKYRGVAFILSVILAINVVIPSTVFAVNFFCQEKTGVSTAGTTVADCCTEPESNNTIDLLDGQKQVDFCTFERTCKQSISDLLTDLQTILPAEKHLNAAFETPSSFKPIFDNSIVSYISLNSSRSYPTPPIFLLNSTFLN